MDPVTTVQVVCGAIQLIDFGIGAAKAFHEICNNKDALTADNTRLESETQSLRMASSQVSSQLQGLSTKLSEEQLQLQKVAQRCEQVANDLITRLDRLKVVGPLSRRRVALQWIKLMREKGAIEKDQEQLQRCRELMDTQMLVNLWYLLHLSCKETRKP